jgi:hypothetical protein
MAKEKNRFAGFEALKSEPVETKPIDQGKVGKSKDSNYKKVTLYLTKDLHFKLRSHSLATTEDMSDLVEQVMNDYFKQLDA